MKKRLDVLLVEREISETRQQAQALIMAGDVQVADHVIIKAGALVAENAQISVRSALKYVGRGGLKLEVALDAFQIEVLDKICADIGASTGGFTDCLIQRGAARIYAVDVGYGQLAWKLRNDPRIVVMDRVNIRYLDRLPELIDMAVVDVAFISLKLVLPALVRLLQPTGKIIALIKPQFEAGHEQVGKGGVVRDVRIHKTVMENLIQFAIGKGWRIRGLCRSPISGAMGNIEYFISLSLDRSLEDIDFAVQIQHVLES